MSDKPVTVNDLRVQAAVELYKAIAQEASSSTTEGIKDLAEAFAHVSDGFRQGPR